MGGTGARNGGEGAETEGEEEVEIKGRAMEAGAVVVAVEAEDEEETGADGGCSGGAVGADVEDSTGMKDRRVHRAIETCARVAICFAGLLARWRAAVDGCSQLILNG